MKRIKIAFFFNSGPNKEFPFWLKYIDDIDKSYFDPIIILRNKNQDLKDSKTKTYILEEQTNSIKWKKPYKNLKKYENFPINELRKAYSLIRSKVAFNEYIDKTLFAIEKILLKEKIISVIVMQPKNFNYTIPLLLFSYVSKANQVLFYNIHGSFFLDNIKVFDNLERIDQRLLKNFQDQLSNDIDDKKALEIKNYLKKYLKLKSGPGFQKHIYKKNISRPFFERIKTKTLKRIVSGKVEDDIINLDENYILYYLNKKNNPRELFFNTYFSDYVNNIHDLAISIPANFKLVVKDHPHNLSNINNRAYKAVNQYDNCLYLSSDKYGLDLVKNAEIVVGGTSGSVLEALMMFKKVIIFGEGNFILRDLDLPIYKIKSPLEIKTKINDFINSKIDEKKLIILFNEILKLKNNVFNNEKIIPLFNSSEIKFSPEDFSIILNDLLIKIKKSNNFEKD